MEKITQIEIQYENNKKIKIKTCFRSITDYYIDCRSLIKKDQKNWTIVKDHPFYQTHINLTGIAPYVLLSFNEKREFKDVTISTSKWNGPYEAMKTGSVFLLLTLKDFNKLINPKEKILKILKV